MKATFSWHVLSTLILILFLGWGYLFIPQHFNSLDNRLRDFLFILRGSVSTTGSVVIVDIDEKSLETYGQWPWSRDVIAELLYRTSQKGAGIIGLDMVFAEPDKTSPSRIANKLSLSGEGLEDYDAMFGEVVAQTPVIGGYFFSFEKKDFVEGPLIPAVFIEKGSGQGRFIPEPSSVVLNIPAIQNAFFSSGFFNNTPDSSGMIRHVPLVMRYDMTIYPSLSMEMLRIYQQAEEVRINNSEIGVSSVEVGDLTVPTDRFGRLSVNFRGAGGTFEYISAADILTERVDAQKLEGKFVLLGTSAIGLSDLRSTPYDSAMPGVEVHANVIDNILAQDFLYKSENAELFDLIIIAVTVIIGVLLFSLLNAWLILPLFFLLLYGMYMLFSVLLFEEGMILNIMFPLTGLVFSMILSVAIDYILTSEQKKAVMRSFARKVSPAVMHDLMKRKDEGLLEPTDKEVTIFFSDIRSFTTLAEEMGSPKQLIGLLNDYMTPMADIIVRHQGTVDKFIGDAIMAYWNAPNAVADHADVAVGSALEQMEALGRLNDVLKAKFDIELEIGIGINTGMVTVGEMGSIGRSDYTIIGDHVNLASRLEGLNKLYGSHIIISSYTKERLTKVYTMRPLDMVRVKGKKEPVEIFEVIPGDMRERYSDSEAEAYLHALEMYRKGRLEEAEKAFIVLSGKSLSKLYDLYLKRCREYLQDPDKTFDPVTEMHTK